MKLFAGLFIAALAGCSTDPTPASSGDPKADEVSEVSSPSEPGPDDSKGFSGETSGAPRCDYAGGCDGDIHPTSGTLTVDGKDCGIDGAAATLNMSPNGLDGENPFWILTVGDGTCGPLIVKGAHLGAYPQSGTFAWTDHHYVTLGGDAGDDAKLTSGPVDYQPAAVRGAATVDGHAVVFEMDF